MTSTRTQIADRLRGLLPAEWLVLATAREFDMPDGTVPAVVAVQRSQIAPAPNYAGAWIETFDVWLITTSQVDDPSLEDDLDALLDTTLEAVDGDRAIALETATRTTYGDRQLHAWQIAIQSISERN
jgi:hypothetical protein